MAISAVTLATHHKDQAVQFYRTLGFELCYGGETNSFSSFSLISGHLNLIAASADHAWSWRGRVIFYTTDVDALYAHVVTQGLHLMTTPQDAAWGERYFHFSTMSLEAFSRYR